MRTRRSQSSSDPVPRDPTESAHRSVLLHEAVSALNIQPTDTVVDATLGGGGHAREIIKALGAKGTFIGFDLDTSAIARAKQALTLGKARIYLIEANFRHMRRELAARGITRIDKALFDLGWSADQLESGRGFSFQREEPLVMTFASSPEERALTASEIVNEWKEESLADIFFGWGEERYARRIARAIVARRNEKPLTTARELAEVVRLAVPPAYRRGRVHPATKTFQALRIAVNDEMGALKGGLEGACELLNKGGRIAVITFHSVEDRVVKEAFARLANGGGWQRVTKKPISPSEGEISANPRARSAKLRVIEKEFIDTYEKQNTKDQQI